MSAGFFLFAGAVAAIAESAPLARSIVTVPRLRREVTDTRTFPGAPPLSSSLLFSLFLTHEFPQVVLEKKFKSVHRLFISAPSLDIRR